jgi:hypothetical protein
MARSVSPRVFFVSVVAALSFAAGLVSTTWLFPREARADSPYSTVSVPREGLTFRAADGHAIARLSYDAQGGRFEVLDDHGDAVATLGPSGRTSSPSLAAPKPAWSLDVVQDPWGAEAPKAREAKVGSGL